jgi:hypothetical protein
MRIASSLALIAVMTSSARARAESTPALAVERGAGAERCLDAGALGAKVEQIRGRPAIDLPNRYHVTFVRTEGGFSATIRSDTSSGSVRTLEHDGANCSALGHAVALTLALLLDSDIEPKPKVEPPPPPSAPAVVATSLSRPPSPTPPLRDATLSLAVAGLAGVLRPVSPALAADVGLRFAPLRVSAGAIWGWPQTLAFGPGTVHEFLLGGFVRVCVPVWQRGSLRFDGCSGAIAGAITAEAEGYTRNERRTRTFIAVPLEAALAGWTSPLGWEVSFAGLLPLRRSDYTIDGLGTVYASPPIGAMVSLRATGIFAW